MPQVIKALRRVSVVRRLLYLFLIQTVVVLMMCAIAVHGYVRRITDDLRLSGSQLLNVASSQMEEALGKIELLTKFPVLQNAYGSTVVFDYLSNSSLNTASELAYNRNLQQELMNMMVLHRNTALLGISTLNGNLIYCTDRDINYQICRLSSDFSLDETLSLRGGCRIIPAEQAQTLYQIPSLPSAAIFGARAIMKLNHLEAVGVVLCCIDLSELKNSFELGRSYPEQTLSVLRTHNLITTAVYGTDSVPADRLQNLQEDKLITQLLRDKDGLAIYQFYRSGELTSILRTPFGCVLNGIRIPILTLVILLILFSISVLIFDRMIVSSIREPIKKLMGVCKRIAQQDFSPVEDSEAHDEMHSLVESFNSMSAQIHQLIEEVYQKNLLQAQTEMQLLRSQINPHFVYNTLESIRASALSQGSSDLAEMTALLGKTLRYGVSSQAEPVTVAQELNHLREYIALQQMHFCGRLTVQINVEEDLLNCRIIKLILQPLVENAIYHGMSMTDGSGLIRVLGYAESDDLVFTVSDDGIGIAPDELQLLCEYVDGRNDAFTSIGLRNTNRRIRLYYGDQYGLSIRSIRGEGTVITVRLPMQFPKGADV